MLILPSTQPTTSPCTSAPHTIHHSTTLSSQATKATATEASGLTGPPPPPLRVHLVRIRPTPLLLLLLQAALLLVCLCVLPTCCVGGTNAGTTSSSNTPHDLAQGTYHSSSSWEFMTVWRGACGSISSSTFLRAEVHRVLALDACLPGRPSAVAAPSSCHKALRHYSVCCTGALLILLLPQWLRAVLLCWRLLVDVHGSQQVDVLP